MSRKDYMQISSGDVSFEVMKDHILVTYRDSYTEQTFVQEIPLDVWKEMTTIINKLVNEVERGLKGEV